MIRCHTRFVQAHRSHARLIKRIWRTCSGTFQLLNVSKAVAGFSAGWIGVHIKEKESFALHEVLRLLVAQYPDHLSGITLVVNVDKTPMFHAFRNGRMGDEHMHDLFKSPF